MKTENSEFKNKIRGLLFYLVNVGLEDNRFIISSKNHSFIIMMQS